MRIINDCILCLSGIRAGKNSHMYHFTHPLTPKRHGSYAFKNSVELDEFFDEDSRYPRIGYFLSSSPLFIAYNTIRNTLLSTQERTTHRHKKHSYRLQAISFRHPCTIQGVFGRNRGRS